MKGIITLLIFICLFQGGVVAQKETAKAKKKEEKASAKKPPSKKDGVSQKRKETRLLAAKKNDVRAPAHEKNEVHPESMDSQALSKENIAVAIDSDSKNQVAPPKQEKTPPPETNPTSDWQDWVPWFSLGLIVVMGICVFWTNANTSARINNIKNQLAAQKSELQWEKTKPLVTSSEIENLINASSSLKRIQEELSVLKNNFEKLQQPIPVVIPVKPIAEPSGSTFYMTGPTNNYFPSSARSNNRENTVYKFMLQSGGNEATFEVHTTGASISEIIKVIESYIKPACDEENLPSSGTRNIVTRKPGRAILENEKWIIKDKAVIRYE